MWVLKRRIDANLLNFLGQELMDLIWIAPTDLILLLSFDTMRETSWNSNISCLLRGWKLLTWTWEGVVPPKTLHFLDSSSFEDDKGHFVGTSVNESPYNESSSRLLNYLLAWLDLSLTRDLALMVAHFNTLTRWFTQPKTTATMVQTE